MGRVTNAAVVAREQARRRRLALDQDRDAREERIDTATAAVILAVDEIEAAEAARVIAVAAAQAVFEAAVATADLTATTLVAEAEQRIGVSLRALVVEKLSGARIAELTELSPAEVRRLSRLGSTDVSAGGTSSVAVAAPSRQEATAVAEPVMSVR